MAKNTFKSGLPPTDGWWWIRKDNNSLARLYRLKEGVYTEFGNLVATDLSKLEKTEYKIGASPVLVE